MLEPPLQGDLKVLFQEKSPLSGNLGPEDEKALSDNATRMTNAVVESMINQKIRYTIFMVR